MTARSLQQDTAAPVRLFSTAYFLILNTGLNGALGIVYWAIAGRLFSRHAVGQSAALVSLMVLLTNVSLFNLSNALPRLLQLSGRHSARLVRHSYTASVLNGALIAGVLAG